MSQSHPESFHVNNELPVPDSKLQALEHITSSITISLTTLIKNKDQLSIKQICKWLYNNYRYIKKFFCNYTEYVLKEQ